MISKLSRVARHLEMKQQRALRKKAREDAIDADMAAKGYEKVVVGKYVGYRVK